MTVQTALNEDLKQVEDENGGLYDKALYERFVLWKDQTGKSLQMIGRMLNRSTAAVSQYINKKFVGSLDYMERDIANMLQREEDLQYAASPDVFCNTRPSKLMWEVLQFCDQKCKMGVILAPSGTGKTETCKEYKIKNRASVYVTADITTRSLGAVLNLIFMHVGGTKGRTISETLHMLIGRLKDSRRLLIIDDAHFLSWEAYEAVRKLHDCAGIGVVYVGQERLYEQMKGQSNKAYLFDQSYSRIAIKRDRFSVTKKDAEAIAMSVYPGLDRTCIDFLFLKAKGKGRFRVMSNLLEVAMEIQKLNNDGNITVDLLREADRFLMI